MAVPNKKQAFKFRMEFDDAVVARDIKKLLPKEGDASERLRRLAVALLQGAGDVQFPVIQSLVEARKAAQDAIAARLAAFRPKALSGQKRHGIIRQQRETATFLRQSADVSARAIIWHHELHLVDLVDSPAARLEAEQDHARALQVATDLFETACKLEAAIWRLDEQDDPEPPGQQSASLNGALTEQGTSADEQPVPEGFEGYLRIARARGLIDVTPARGSPGAGDGGGEDPRGDGPAR